MAVIISLNSNRFKLNIICKKNGEIRNYIFDKSGYPNLFYSYSVVQHIGRVEQRELSAASSLTHSANPLWQIYLKTVQKSYVIFSILKQAKPDQNPLLLVKKCKNCRYRSDLAKTKQFCNFRPISGLICHCVTLASRAAEPSTINSR